MKKISKLNNILSKCFSSKNVDLPPLSLFINNEFVKS